MAHIPKGPSPTQGIGKATQPPPPPPEDLGQQIHDFIAEARTEGMVVDRETMFISTSMVKLKEKMDTQSYKDAVSQKNPGLCSELAEVMLAMMDAEQIERQKRKKKKTPLELKMEELEQLEVLIDKSQLDENEREELEKLFTNMSRIKSLKGKLKQLEDQEEKLEEEVRKQLEAKPNTDSEKEETPDE